MNAPLPNAAAPVVPDVEQAFTFCRLLFQPGDIIHFRAPSDKKGDNRRPTNHHYLYDDNFRETLRGFLAYCDTEQRAAFVLPGPVKGNGTKAGDVLSLSAVLVDFDKGDPSASLAAAEAAIGPASIVIESGGVTAEGKQKLHAHWLLSEKATGKDITAACKVREELARQFGGDPAFKQPGQVCRVAGSVHHKGRPTLVRTLALRPSAVVLLPDVLRTLGVQATLKTNPANNVIRPTFWDLNEVICEEPDTDRVLTQDTHEGGIDEFTRFESIGKAIGYHLHLVRIGTLTLEAAWDAVKLFNATRIVPPWSEERLRHDFDRLVARDIREKGAFVVPAPVMATQAPVMATQATGIDLRKFYTRHITGPAPARKWLVEGLLPLAVPTVFAAVGDAGKSMLALRLALFTSCYGPSKGATDLSDPMFFGYPVRGRGTAVVITGEDDSDEIHRRLESLDPSGAWRADSSRLIVLPLLSAGGVRAIITDGPLGPQLTPFWQDLREQLTSFDDLALIVIDPLSHFIAGDANDNTLAAALMAECGTLATATGATVMLIAHLNKAAGKILSLTDARNAIRGASAFVDNSRASIVLWEASEDEAFDVLKTLDQKERARNAGVVYFGGLTKGNAPGAKVKHAFVRSPAGVLEDVTDKLRDLAPKAGDVDAKLHALLLEHSQKHGLLSFTASPKALETAWGQFIRKHNLPITREGRRRGTESITTVFNRMLDKGLLVQQTADRGPTPRYEPVAP